MCSAATSRAQVANLRAVDWQSLGINFVLVYSPGAFRGAPHTSIATLTFPNGGGGGQETALLKAAADAFPAVTLVRVKDALDAVGGLVANLVTAVRGASILCILSAVLVLGGALAASHRHRVYEAVVLKTLGATRGRLLAAYILEYLVLGTFTALFGVADRFDRGLVRRQRRHEPSLRMVTGSCVRGGDGCAGPDGHFRADRHAERPGAKARTGAAKPVSPRKSTSFATIRRAAAPDVWHVPRVILS